MEKTIAELDALVKNTKKGRCDKKIAADLFIALFNEDKNVERISKYLFEKFHYTICGNFFFKCKMTDDEASGFVNALTNGKYNKTDIYNYGFQLCSAFLRKNIHLEQAYRMLIKMLNFGWKDGAFNGYLIDNYNKCIRTNKIEAQFVKLLEFAQKDWDKNLVNRFIDVVEKENSVKNHPNKKLSISDSEKDLLTESKTNSNEQVIHLESNITRKDVNDKLVPLSSEFLDAIKKSISESVKSAFDSQNATLNNTIASLKVQIAAKECELAEIKKDSEQRINRISLLEAEIQRMTVRLKEYDNEVAKHKERADVAYQMDTAGKEQALLTLKSDIADSLKLEYEDYLIGKDAECNLDNYEAAQASLQRIFKILKRFGISIK